MTDTTLDRVQQALGYNFKDITALRAALTHRSWSSEHATPREQTERFGADNERLEFLGDSILGVVITEALWHKSPTSSEGVLSRLRSAVVNEASLAEVATRTQVGLALRLGRGEERSGGRGRPSLLADALEAVFAAVYLDGGFEAARAVVLLALGERVERVVSEGVEDFKSALQELLQASHKVTPRYRLVATYGPDHDREHEVELEAESIVVARGRGRSKKDAEQAAARTALETMRGGSTGENARGSASGEGRKEGDE
jgi:ribonuclease-3